MMAMRQDGSFKGRHFTSEVILWAWPWYLAFPISYRDLSACSATRRMFARVPDNVMPTTTSRVTRTYAVRAVDVVLEASSRAFASCAIAAGAWSGMAKTELTLISHST